MKVLALNSGPRSESESYTVMMLNLLVEGMRDAGAEVEVINLREKKIGASTPIAKGLLGHKVGDVVEIRVPAGLMKFEIESIEI